MIEILHGQPVMQWVRTLEIQYEMFTSEKTRDSLKAASGSRFKSPEPDLKRSMERYALHVASQSQKSLIRTLSGAATFVASLWKGSKGSL